MSQVPNQPQGNAYNPAGGQMPMPNQYAPQNQMPQGQYQTPQPPKKPFYKKPWFIILAVIIVIGIIVAAAGGGDSSSSSSSSGNSDNAGTSEQADNTQPAGDSQPADKAEVDTDYPITIDGAEVVTDSLGDKAIVVTYTWTNNSDKNASFDVALDAKAYQNGVELEVNCFVDGAECLDVRDVRPGTTTTLKQAYKLADTSEVEVEVKELLSFNDDIIASQKFAVQ